MKKNICILCRDNDFAKKVAYVLSRELDMFFADVDDMIAYNLADLMSIKDKIGEEYINDKIKGQISMVSSFENTIYTLSISTMNIMEEPQKLQNDSLVIFLDTPTKIRREQITKDNLVKIMRKIADIFVTLDNKRTKESANIIKKQILEKYK